MGEEKANVGRQFPSDGVFTVVFGQVSKYTTAAGTVAKQVEITVIE